MADWSKNHSQRTKSIGATMADVAPSATVHSRKVRTGSQMLSISETIIPDAAVGAAPASISAMASALTPASAGESVTWGFCAVDCPCRCPLRFHVRAGHVVKVEPYRASGTGVAPVACHRGLAMGALAESPTRLRYPLLRTGKRGSGQFKRVSWDEAIDRATSELKRVIGRYGNEAVYINYGTGAWSSTTKSFQRLLNLVGGKLGRYNNYSNPQIKTAARLMYGRAGSGSSLGTAAHAQTVIAFGWNPVITRQGGGADRRTWPRAERALAAAGANVYIIDPRKTESVRDGAEWVPIKPGTDAALVAAIAHELIENDAIDQAFLHRFCRGFDEGTLPERFRGKGLSYRAYVMGAGFDRTEKTPAWAQGVTGVPAAKIREIARAVAESDPLYVTQGWGPQRRSNGEWTAWAVMALPCLVGQVGRLGTNDGQREASASLTDYGLPTGESPVGVSIPAFLFTDAIAHPETMTRENEGVRGADRLRCGIKYLINYASNCLTNQHGDINRTHDILVDEGACEFILGIDCEMTDSAKYCDLLLPDLYRFELPSQSSAGFDGTLWLTTGTPAPTERYERKSAYEIAALMAAKLGVRDAFTCGRTEEDWARLSYERTRRRHADFDLPSWDDAVAQGVVTRPIAPRVALVDFVADPARNPLPTASGKIEFFNEKLAARAFDGAGLAALPPLPAYVPEWEGAQTADARFPLQLTGYHSAARVHSIWGGLEELQKKWAEGAVINSADAAARGIVDGDAVRVFNDRGSCELPAHVTDEIAQGVVAISQGAWHDADMDGDRVDHAGSINVLTGHRASPLAFGNPQHTNLCQVERAARKG
jgi:Tat-targeted selenate reductase subunit YnfE